MNLVIGAGAIGTVVAGTLLRSGQPVQLQVRPQKIAAMREFENLTLLDAHGKMLVSVPAPTITGGETVADAQHIFLCMKRGDLAQALHDLTPQLSADTVLLPCINGVGLVDAVRRVHPNNPVAPATIMLNARMESPLCARLTTRAEILVGGDRPDLHKLFSDELVKTAVADDATEWGKLLINLNNAICALTHRTFSDLFGGEKSLMQCFLLVLDEAIKVLRHANIAYTMPAPVPYSVYRFMLKHGRGLPLWIARRKNGLSDEAHPSMRADLEQGRRTEVDYLNGAVVELAHKQGLQAPVNAKLVKLVHAREAQKNATDWSPKKLLSALENA